MSKQNLIVVIYVGIANYMDNGYAPEEYMTKIAEAIQSNEKEGIVQYLVPDYESNNVRVECINPIYVTKEEYARIEEKLKTIEKNIDNLIYSK